MKRYFSTAMAIAFAMAMSAQTLFVGTYNVRQHNDDDDKEGNAWAVRSKVIADQINFEDPDAFGTQEAFKPQLDDLTSLLDGYDHIGVARDDGKESGEHSAIFYKKDRLKLLRHGDFWLSETPEKPGLGWDAACIRICTWGEFKQKATGFKFYYFNLHMDHVGVVARREAAKLAVAKIKELAKGAPVVLTGDFNVDQNDEIYTIFTTSGVLKDSYECAAFRFAENGTFNSFDPSLKSDSRIDHVFVSPEFNVGRYGMLTNMYWTKNEAGNSEELKGHDAPQELSFKEYQLRTPSDHYPVLVKMKYGK
jgi:endonuclease/exonuclease/phosphatase family metal-dependent hydrolase